MQSIVDHSLLFAKRMTSLAGSVLTRNFSSSQPLNHLIKLTRVRVVDNSAIGKAAKIIGKPPRVIHVYTKTGIARVGDKVLLAIKGQKKRAYVVGCRQYQRPMVPRYDTNNVVLIEDNGTPTGTRITVPIPSDLRGKNGDFTKVLALAARFL